MRFAHISLAVLLICLASLPASHAQETKPGKEKDAAAPSGPKVCVAGVANSSMQPLFIHDIREHLVEELRKQGLNAAETSTTTVIASKLGLTGNNRDTMKLRSCRYLVLSEVTSQAAPSIAPQAPAESAANAPATANGKFKVRFAVFQKGRAKSVLEDSLDLPPAEKLNDAVIASAPEQASRIAAGLKK